MNNIDRIVNYIKGGCTNRQQIGLELEHFVCDENYKVISYEEMAQCLEEISRKTGGKAYREKGKILGVDCCEYAISLEPGCQLEISIAPKEDFDGIKNVYEEFRKVCRPIFKERGYDFLEGGVFPLVERGDMCPDELPLIPKERYALMDRRFQNSGTKGRYMMRASAATQVSIDFVDEQDALKKLRVLAKLAPILALAAEHKSGVGTGENWKPHLLRSQIWRDVDAVRCGYFEGSVAREYSFEKYARHVYSSPCILLKRGEEVTDLQEKSAADAFGEQELDIVEHVLSMYFPTVRLKKYIEYRVADAMPIEEAVGFAALVKAVVYNRKLLDSLDEKLSGVQTVAEVYGAEDAVMEDGFHAAVYGKPVLEWMEEILWAAMEVSSPREQFYIRKIFPLPLLNYEYKKSIVGVEDAHRESAKKIREYLLNSTAKYHNRVVRTLYIPKLFTQKEVDKFSRAVEELYGIFDKVIGEFQRNPQYRALFGFPKELEELILRENKYSCNIPISRIDIFYQEETGDFKFCEFNTDGTSAMNEDRELNIAFRTSKAYQEFAGKHCLTSFELFDTWVEEALKLYEEYAANKRAGQEAADVGRKTEGELSVLPKVAIVDFMENATTNEFYIFKERFEKKGCKAFVCDIRELKWDGERLFTPEGEPIDLIYRRAVTSDILTHFSEVGDFLEAVKRDQVCLLGDFRTQIVHNKILYKILHMEETLALLTGREQVYVKAHVPYTVSLDTIFEPENETLRKAVFENKDGWIIKPEDSYGSKGVHAGVELEKDSEWVEFLNEARGQKYILQEFHTPYRLSNIDLLAEDWKWITTSNLSGLFVYNGKFCGVYSRISFDKMISTQYNEMSVPTMLVC